MNLHPVSVSRSLLTSTLHCCLIVHFVLCQSHFTLFVHPSILIIPLDFSLLPYWLPHPWENMSRQPYCLPVSIGGVVALPDRDVVSVLNVLVSRQSRDVFWNILVLKVESLGLASVLRVWKNQTSRSRLGLEDIRCRSWISGFGTLVLWTSMQCIRLADISGRK